MVTLLLRSTFKNHLGSLLQHATGISSVSGSQNAVGFTLDHRSKGSKRLWGILKDPETPHNPAGSFQLWQPHPWAEKSSPVIFTGQVKTSTHHLVLPQDKKVHKKFLKSLRDKIIQDNHFFKSLNQSLVIIFLFTELQSSYKMGNKILFTGKLVLSS